MTAHNSPTKAKDSRTEAPGTRDAAHRHRRNQAHTAGYPRPDGRARPRLHNRLAVLLEHAPWLTVRGQARLARDAGCARSTVSRLVRHRTSPSCALAQRLTDALARRLGRPLALGDVFSLDGSYDTASGCALCGCPGCLPERAYDAEGNLLPEWRGQRPGDWSVARPKEQSRAGAAAAPGQVAGTASGKGGE